MSTNPSASVIEQIRQSNKVRTIQKRIQILEEFVLYLILRDIDQKFFKRNGDDLSFKYIFVNDEDRLVVGYIHEDEDEDYADTEDKEFDISDELNTKYLYLLTKFNELKTVKGQKENLDKIERDIRNIQNYSHRTFNKVVQKHYAKRDAKEKNAKLQKLHQASRDLNSLINNSVICETGHICELLSEMKTSVDADCNNLQSKIKEIELTASKKATAVTDRVVRIQTRTLESRRKELQELLSFNLELLGLSEDCVNIIPSNILYI